MITSILMHLQFLWWNALMYSIEFWVCLYGIASSVKIAPTDFTIPLFLLVQTVLIVSLSALNRSLREQMASLNVIFIFAQCTLLIYLQVQFNTLLSTLSQHHKTKTYIWVNLFYINWLNLHESWTSNQCYWKTACSVWWTYIDN